MRARATAGNDAGKAGPVRGGSPAFRRASTPDEARAWMAGDARESGSTSAPRGAAPGFRFNRIPVLAGERAGVIQASLSLGAIDDPHEREAERVASAVMGTRDASRAGDAPTIAPIMPGAVQRACAGCAKDDDETLRRDPQATATAGGPVPASVHAVLRGGGGAPLPSATRAFMEPRFGHDFSRVRVHEGGLAAASTRDVGANAYTVGWDIVFGAGRYAPESGAGQRLLAHELTHVVQQRGSAGGRVQRQVATDKHDLTSSELSGDPVLERCFDGDARVRIFQVGDHVTRLQKALVKLGFELPVFGVDGKYDTETAGAVKKFQRAVGISDDGIVGERTIAHLDRSLRNAAIQTDVDAQADDFVVKNKKAVAADDDCKDKPSSVTCPSPNEKVTKGADAAIALIDKVLATQLPPVKGKTADEDYPAIFSRIFRGDDARPMADTVSEVRATYLTVRNFVARLKTEPALVRCGTECDGGCRAKRPAYHTHRGDTDTHVITFCPAFETFPDAILVVIHESHHASVNGSSDKAYRGERLFDLLDHATALLNAASFHVYAGLVDKPASQVIGPAIKDTNLISDATEKQNVAKALAFLEHWFSLINFDISGTVRGAREARRKGAYTTDERHARFTMDQVFSPRFGLTSPPAVPSPTDVTTLLAIEERTGLMEKAFDGPLVIVPTSAESFWIRGPARDLALNQAIRKLDIPRMTTALLQELVHATPDISAESEPRYVLAINDLRNGRSLPP